MREMKDSGIAWAGNIPESWAINKGKYIMQLLNRPTKETDDVITCFRDGEVTLRSHRREEGFTISLTEAGYQGIEIGDLVVHGMDGFAGAIGISDSRGKATPVLNVLDSCQNKKYLVYLMRAMAYCELFMSLSTGIRVRTCDTNWKKLREIDYLVPPLIEQQHIADFLDAKCSEIDSLASDIRSEIDTLEQYKRSLVFETISRGISKSKLKSTGTDVWRAIPEGWKLVDIKYIFEIVKRIAGKEGYDILAVTQQGLKVKDISNNEGQIASDYSGYQFVYPTDFVMNHMDLITGWVDCSEYFGVTSPDYRVFRLRDKEYFDLQYYKYVLQCCYMCRIFYSLGQGVSNLGRWRLQTSAFLDFKLPVPPTPVQRDIGKFLSEKVREVDHLVDKKQEQLSTLDSYKKSLIFEYVTGKKEVPVA